MDEGRGDMNLTVKFPSPEEALEAAQPSSWLAAAYDHRGPESAESVVFRCLGETGEVETIYAHRLPLAARSPWFAYAFESLVGTRGEAKPLVVRARAQAVEAMLYFVYLDELPEFGDYSLAELHSLACIYRIESLALRVAKVISSNISVENVVDVLQESVLMRAEHLKKICSDFISCHQDEVSDSHSFKLLRARNNPTDAEMQTVNLIFAAVFREKEQKGNEKVSEEFLMTVPLHLRKFTDREERNDLALQKIVPNDSKEEKSISKTKVNDRVNMNISEQGSEGNSLVKRINTLAQENFANSSLPTDMAKCLEEGVGADLILVSAIDGGSITCSQFVLAMHSPYFASLPRDRELKEFVDATTAALETLLRFLYTGELTGNPVTMVELTPVAHEYSLFNLITLLQHIPALMVHPETAIETLQELRKRNMLHFNVAESLQKACYSHVHLGWKEIGPELANLENDDQTLFLTILRGAFGRSTTETNSKQSGEEGNSVSGTQEFDDDALQLEDRTSASHWNGAAPLLRQLVLDYIGNSGYIPSQSPLCCGDIFQSRVTLKLIDLLDDIGAGILAENIGDAVLKQISERRIHSLLRLLFKSERIGCMSGRDAMLCHMLPTLALLPDLDTFVKEDHEKSVAVLVHLSKEKNDFVGKKALEKALIEHIVEHVGEVPPRMYEKLPYKVQMTIITERMRSERKGQRHIIGPTGNVLVLEPTEPRGKPGEKPHDGRWRNF
eukprot:g5494.t1